MNIESSKFLEQFAEEIDRLDYYVYRVAEIRGEHVFAKDLLPAPACLNSYSIAKAFTVTAAGLLYDRGILSPEERIVDIFQEELPKIYDPNWEKMTIDHVMRHHGGFPGGYLDIDAQEISEYGTDDFLQYLFDTTLHFAPGEKWCYSDAAFYLMSRVVTKKTGRLLDELLWREIFYPLGFQEMAWSKCPMGYPMGGTGLYLRTQDLVKLGALYYSGGVFGGKRILSGDWISTVLERGYELCPVGAGDAYGKGGMCGQMLLVFPGAKRAVAWHAFDGKDMDPLIQWLYEHIDG